MALKGWRITGIVALGLLALAVGMLATHGFNEDAVRILVRNTARVSVVLFTLAFSASSLHALLRRQGSAWLLANRRYLGVSFALSHFAHLLALLALLIWYPHPFIDGRGVGELAGGALAYAFILAMTVTSFDGPRHWLGPSRWRLLHTAGSYYIWLLFTLTYVPLALVKPAYAPFAVALLVALGLRIVRAVKRRSAGLSSSAARPGPAGS